LLCFNQMTKTVHSDRSDDKAVMRQVLGRHSTMHKHNINIRTRDQDQLEIIQYQKVHQI